VDDSGSVIPRAMVDRLTLSRHAFFAIETVSQAKRALFDLRLFGAQRETDGSGSQSQHQPHDIMDQIEAQFPVSPAAMTHT
jgi:Zn-dependent oligopeptidase